MKPIYVGFYTKNTPYEEEAKKMSDSLGRFNLSCHLYPIDSKRSWLKNAMYKPQIILQAWKDFNQPIVYLDADSRVENYPSLFEDCLIKEDFAVHVRSRNGISFFTCTLFFNRTKNALSLIENWAARCEKGESAIQRELPAPYYKVNTDSWSVADQGPLVNAYLEMKDNKSDISLFNIPKSYAVKYHSKQKERVIVQYQKSNSYKKSIK